MLSENVQKYILATSDFAKRIQNDINHYVTRDRINDASFRQKLDPISKNILRRQNPLELVFEYVSTFDSENPIVGSLVRELYLKKKGTDSDFIKSLPSVPGKNFEIQKRLDRLRDLKDPHRKNNNNNNNNNSNNNKDGGGNLFPPEPGPGLPPLPPNFPQPPPPHIPDELELQNRFDILRGNREPPTNAFNLPPKPPFFANNASNFHIPAQSSSFNRRSMGNPPSSGNLFGSQTVTMTSEATKEGKVYETTQDTVDDYLYELPDNVELELGDGLVENLQIAAHDLLRSSNVALEQIKQDYGFDEIKDAFDECFIPVFTSFMVEKVKFFFKRLSF